MRLVGSAKFFQFYDPCFISYPPRDNLLCMLSVICFDDRPTTVCAIMAAPFKVMQISRGMDFLNNSIAVACLMRRFNKITVHMASPLRTVMLSKLYTLHVRKLKRRLLVAQSIDQEGIINSNFF